MFHVLRAHREPFWRENRPIPFLIWFVVLFVVSDWLSTRWVFEYPEQRSRDILSAAVRPVPARYTTVVTVDRNDYRDIFDELLTPDRLNIVIQRLFEYDPAVVVVDFDTSARRFASLRSHDNPKIIWARGVEIDEPDRETGFELSPILGGYINPFHWGLALFPHSPDWTVRKYQRAFPVGSRIKPAVYWEAVTAFCALPQGSGVAGCSHVKTIGESFAAGTVARSELEVQVRHARYNFPKVFLRNLMPDDKSSVAQPVSATSPLAGRIVILGGGYSAADKHQTVFGIMDGIELIGSAVESELNLQVIRDLSLMWELAFNVLLSGIIAICYHRLRPHWALAFSLCLVALLVFLGPFFSIVAGYRTSAVSFALGILIEQLTRGADARNELHRCKEELAQCKSTGVGSHSPG